MLELTIWHLSTRLFIEGGQSCIYHLNDGRTMIGYIQELRRTPISDVYELLIKNDITGESASICVKIVDSYSA